jgi:16S rRNA (adenine1518-N6/adenine1519-N6)-dimethyltransferase
MKIKEICQKFKIVPLKKRGQNFLINKRILEKILKVAEIKKDDTILEIGAGFGNLTEELAKKAKKVIAVEIDKKLVEFLKEKFKNKKNVEIIEGDILKISVQNLLKENDYKLVANLPYSITGAVLKKFLTQEPKPKEMVLMVQKEVAERIVEKNKKRSIISLMVNFYSFPKIVCYVSKNNFWPRPKVDSALLKISKIKSIKIDPNSFFKLIKKGFSNPRKQLINNLAQLIEKEKIKKIFKNLKIDPQIRAEDLNLKDWLKIYQKFQKYL